MPLNLTANEARIIGCLMEKSVVTPDQYPLTLNALVKACNQKSSRNPVMSLEQGLVQRTTRGLGDKHLVHVDMNFKSGVEKYKQRFCNTNFSDFKFDPPQYAIVCLLLLRGPQTPGELRANSGRMHTFADNAAVVETLDTLIKWEGDPLVVKLPLTPGRKDSEYMHLFSGPIEIKEQPVKTQPAQGQPAKTRPVVTSERVTMSELIERVKVLEDEVARIKEQLK